MVDWVFGDGGWLLFVGCVFAGGMLIGGVEVDCCVICWVEKVPSPDRERLFA